MKMAIQLELGLGDDLFSISVYSAVTLKQGAIPLWLH